MATLKNPAQSRITRSWLALANELTGKISPTRLYGLLMPESRNASRILTPDHALDPPTNLRLGPGIGRDPSRSVWVMALVIRMNGH